MKLAVLGPLLVVDDAEVARTPPGGLQRRLLVALLVEAGRAVAVDRLADAMWPEALPANHLAAVQTHVFRIRKSLPGLVIEHDLGGYRIVIEGHAVDALVFEHAIGSAVARRDTDSTAARRDLDAALALWRGEPYAELPDSDAARAERVRLGELRLRALDERFELLIDSGRAHDAIGDLEAATVANPTRERTHAQLMRALVAAGRSVDALRTFDRFRVTLASELGLEPSPELRSLHDAIVTGDAPATSRPPASDDGGLRPAPPRPATRLVGRDGDLAMIVATLASSPCLTLIGTGGVGKTRLAAEAVQARASDPEREPWWFELAASGPATVLDAIAAQLGIQGTARAELPDRIVAVLRHEGRLVVLDNCEHVLDVIAPLVERLLAARVRVLATSRERLAVEGERLFAVAPLSTGTAGAGADGGTEGAAIAAAVELFVERGRAVDPHLAENVSTGQISELCTQLGGLPLAIELAASRLHTMTVAEISAAIATGLGVLSGQRRRAERHRSLTATLEWSFALLEPDEREALVAVSTFRSGFETEAAAAVWDRSIDATVDTLRTITERSLVQRSGERWQLLEPVRQFAAESPEHRPARAAALGRHAEHHLALADQLGSELAHGDAAASMERLDAMLPDLRAVHEWLTEHREVDSLARLVLALRDYGAVRPRAEVLTWGLDAAELAPEHPLVPDLLAFAALAAWVRGGRRSFGELVDRAEAAVGPGNDVPAAVAHVLALRAMLTGHVEETVRWCARARTGLDPGGVAAAEARSILVHALAGTGDPRLDDEVDGLLRDLIDRPEGIAAAIGWYVAGDAVADRDPDAATERLERSIDMALRLGAGWVATSAGAALAANARRRGRHDRAAELHRWLLPRTYRLGDDAVVVTLLRSAAALLAQRGRPRDAAVVLGAIRSTSGRAALFAGEDRRRGRLAEELEAVLGGDAFDAATREGSGIDTWEAIDVVLGALA